MKFSVSLDCFLKDMSLGERIRQVASLGYCAVEMWMFPEREDPKKIKEICDESGVTFLSLCPYEFCMNRAEKRADYLEGLARGCEVASVLGAKKLITQVGDDTGESRARQHAAILETLEKSKPILDAYDITLMLEPLNTRFDHKGYYLDSSRESFALVKEAAHPHIKVVYDIYHMQVMEGNIIPTVTENIDMIAHFHAAGHPGRHELTLGENDYRNIFAAIDQTGFDGFCGLEYHPSMDSIQSLKLTMNTYGK